MKKLLLFLSLLTAGLFAAESTPAMRNVRDYGAAGDGKTLDTAAIQRAIDDGGIVHFPSGLQCQQFLSAEPRRLARKELERVGKENDASDGLGFRRALHRGSRTA